MHTIPLTLVYVEIFFFHHTYNFFFIYIPMCHWVFFLGYSCRCPFHSPSLCLSSERYSTIFFCFGFSFIFIFISFALISSKPNEEKQQTKQTDKFYNQNREKNCCASLPLWPPIVIVISNIMSKKKLEKKNVFFIYFLLNREVTESYHR